MLARIIWDARQALDEVGIALIGDDHCRPGLRNEEIRAGDPHIGAEIDAAQHVPRLAHKRCALALAALSQMRMVLVEQVRNLRHRLVHSRADDVARRLICQLHDIFAEIGLDDLETGRFQMRVEADFLSDHGLCLGNDARTGAFAQPGDQIARFLPIARPVHRDAGAGCCCFIGFEVMIEMCEHMVLDGLPAVAQRIEFGQALNRPCAIAGEIDLQRLQRLPQVRIRQRAAALLLELRGFKAHQPAFPAMGGWPVRSASTSAT